MEDKKLVLYDLGDEIFSFNINRLVHISLEGSYMLVCYLNIDNEEQDIYCDYIEVE